MSKIVHFKNCFDLKNRTEPLSSQTLLIRHKEKYYPGLEVRLPNISMFKNSRDLVKKESTTETKSAGLGYTAFMVNKETSGKHIKQHIL